ncbi:unnamed protein product, partial [Mesorhabditis belari]|uniref:Receptor protein-tyrosine kinase n=1 Tax=Mesorhabditis belari TaxID=2138241 RepID=A0AAF3EY28_9BILA
MISVCYRTSGRWRPDDPFPGSLSIGSLWKVINVPGKELKNRKQHASPEEYDEYEAMERGRLPHEEDADLYSVPDGAAGPGYAPVMPASRWLDRIKMKTGECIAYRGDACRNFLAGRHVMITSENREDMYDIDRNLRAAMLFIGQMPAVSAECKQYSQAVACYHMYKVCEEKVGPRTQRICRNDCERIQKDICPNEYAMAAQHELVGDGPKALLPSCASLPLSTQTSNCISVIDSPKMTSIGPPAPPPGQPASSSHCYMDNGKNYEGSVSTTESGHQCMTWTESHMSRDFTVRNYPQLKNAKNHCRNPGGKRTKPWCFSRPHGREEYCEISQCSIDQTHRIDGPRSNGTNPSNLSEMWWSLPANLQLGLLAGGFVALALLLFIICCACCCKNKKKSSKQRGQQPVPHFSVTSAPTSIVASGTNSGYCRKLQMNGTSTPILGRTAPMEMAALLPQQHNNNMGTGPPSYADSYRTMPHHDEPYHILEIPARDLAVGDQIGIGQFGIVFAAQWHTNVSHEPLTVAVKTTRPDAPIQEIKQLEDEVRRVAAFDHLHVVRLLGVSYLDAGRLSAVFEYMIYGNVHDLISVKSSGSEAEKRADHDEFIRIATQIAHGMEYLISHRFIHRDLAARNCLVGENRVIKVMTFGMMRSAYEGDYYPMMHRGRLPIRWMSREALEGQRYGEPSDVWAFGVTLWEMFSYGRTPYEGLSDQQVIGAISTRQLLECPPMCPPNIYSLMVECWTENPDRRPTFAEIRPRLEAWTMNSPAHSLLQHRAPSASTNSGSSGAAPRGGGSFGNVGVGNNRSHPPFHSSTGLRSRRAGDEGSPLVRRDGAYNYSDDDDDEAAESD